MKIGFIGLGNMAGAMIGGILKQEIISPTDILGTDIFPETATVAEKRFGIKIKENNILVVQEADIIVLAVKPQFYSQVIAQIKDTLKEEQIVLTIAPGKTLQWLSTEFGTEHKFVRCMPNTPALVGEGCTGVCCNEKVTKAELTYVLSILSSFGKASIVPEHLMDVVVGISGSSPAYVFLLIEAMADQAVAEGMPRAQAYEFAAQAVLGSAKMVLETRKHPGELKDMVCSPGGTTIQAVKVLEETGFRAAVMDAVEACVDKSRSM